MFGIGNLFNVFNPEQFIAEAQRAFADLERGDFGALLDDALKAAATTNPEAEAALNLANIVLK